MYQVIFSVDYEIHGNGDGSPFDLMIQPTKRMVDLFEKYDAKLTIFADVAEILKFKEYYNVNGYDKFHYIEIEKQLKYLVKNGHDVQLHIHSSYFNAKYENKKWEQNWDDYNLAELPKARIKKIINECKDYLENTLSSINPDYKCNIFRAANWSMMPSYNIISVLEELGFIIDSSVYKYGKRKGRVNYNYSSAKSDLIPWFINKNNINESDNEGKILEVPIYSENKSFLSFITPIRLFRMVRAKFHQHKTFPQNNEKQKDETKKNNFLRKLMKNFTNKHAWKLDFNQANSTMLISACKRIESKYNGLDIDLPIVCIGHSKTFIKYNEFTLLPFIKFIKNSKNYQFSLYRDINRDSFK